MKKLLSRIALLLCLALPVSFVACSDDDDVDDATLIYEKITSTYHAYLAVYVEDEQIAYGTSNIAKGFETPYLVIEAQGKRHYLNLNYLRTMTLKEGQYASAGTDYIMRLYFSGNAYKQPQP